MGGEQGILKPCPGAVTTNKRLLKLLRRSDQLPRRKRWEGIGDDLAVHRG